MRKHIKKCFFAGQGSESRSNWKKILFLFFLVLYIKISFWKWLYKLL